MGDLSFCLEQGAFGSLATVQGLTNHVAFPAYEQEWLLDPVLLDLLEVNVYWQPNGSCTAQ